MTMKMHLGWFLNFAPPQWLDPFDQIGTSWTNGDFHVEVAGCSRTPASTS